MARNVGVCRAHRAFSYVESANGCCQFMRVRRFIFTVIVVGCSVKVLLKQRTGKKFLSEHDEWVDDETNARDFRNSVAAMEYSRTHSTGNTVILLKFHDPRYDLELRNASG